MGIIAWIIIGAIAGWLAGQIVKGAGFGLLGNIVVGIVGAVVAGWLLPQLGIRLGGGWIGEIINGAIGGIVVLVILSLIRRA
ncbi:MAG: GlsB/YeaQ/YmgE family stress response membrane protein [Afipia sp.]